ncbi:hypothetical protein FALBO_12380 [Fusarium albosuccineum]|uniref:Uncharacterized protein n=1 Tax=Fusarium albosuccineum TaxID=1237068 RepID=A0A8H4L397_9HYPO|nr:hypothetical protein FALBO_12380 [Fusarium albosuccineum]
MTHSISPSGIPLPHVINGDDGTHARCVDGISIIPHPLQDETTHGAAALDDLLYDRPEAQRLGWTDSLTTCCQTFDTSLATGGAALAASSHRGLHRGLHHWILERLVLAHYISQAWQRKWLLLFSRCMIDACVDVLPLPGALEFESMRVSFPPTHMRCGPGTTTSSTLPNTMHSTHLPVSLVEERDFCNPVVSEQPYIPTHITRPWQARIALHVIFLSRNSAPELGRISRKSFFMAVTITARRFMPRTIITRNHNSKLDPGALQLSYSVLPG